MRSICITAEGNITHSEAMCITIIIQHRWIMINDIHLRCMMYCFAIWWMMYLPLANMSGPAVGIILRFARSFYRFFRKLIVWREIFRFCGSVPFLRKETDAIPWNMGIYRKYISVPWPAVIKLTKQSLYTARDCTEKGSKIAGFIVFGGGKLYIGTANRRKQSTK